ncbi:MAG TPA: nitrilase-related carbon-nitrogen hydrolase, partial [Thermoanaerobaculia bacterium]|nr:nitrilase-related carbon-nitrogen hydrolase [Thermoanaerobaculia bacterium]
NGELHNDCPVFSPEGGHAFQGKMHMTRWESEEWFVKPRPGLKIFETSFGKMAVAICYDVEFPEIARAAGRSGCDVLVVPSCTDDRQGFLRVRYCAQARAIENQMFVIHSCTVGSLPMVPAVSLNYGQASILTPSDFFFGRDGILAEGTVNSEMMIIGVLELDELRLSRERGTVLPLRDSQSTAHVLANLEEVAL